MYLLIIWFHQTYEVLIHNVENVENSTAKEVCITNSFHRVFNHLA